PDRRRVVGIGRAMPYDHVADAARCLAAHGHQAAPIVEVAILDDDVLRGPVDAQSVLVLPGLDGDGVVVVVDIHVAHAHLARRVDVDAIRARNVWSHRIEMPSTTTSSEYRMCRHQTASCFNRTRVI